jgi:hypothetical protein
MRHMPETDDRQPACAGTTNAREAARLHRDAALAQSTANNFPHDLLARAE